MSAIISVAGLAVLLVSYEYRFNKLRVRTERLRVGCNMMAEHLQRLNTNSNTLYKLVTGAISIDDVLFFKQSDDGQTVPTDAEGNDLSEQAHDKERLH